MAPARPRRVSLRPRPAVALAVDADPTPVVSTTSPTTSETLGRHHPAVGVTDRDHLGPGVVRRPQDLYGVVAFARAVEEVLGVEDHLLALLPQVSRPSPGSSRGSPRAWSAAPARRAARAPSPPASPRSPRCRAVRRSTGRRPPSYRPPGGPERRQLRVLAGPAPPARDGRTPCPWGSRPASRPRCIRRRVRRAAARSSACRRRTGSAPPAGRRRAGSCRRRGTRPGVLLLSFGCRAFEAPAQATKKPLRERRGWRAGRMLDALANDDAVLVHASMLPRSRAQRARIPPSGQRDRGTTSPWSNANTTAAARSRSPSLAKTWPTCVLTVPSPRTSSLGDPAVAQPCPDQGQHLSLPRREHVELRARAGGRRAVPVGLSTRPVTAGSSQDSPAPRPGPRAAGPRRARP